MKKNSPQVGIGIIIIRKRSPLSRFSKTPIKEVLLGLRFNKEKLGHNEWSLPGGHLEFKESFEKCGKRETFEETGIELDESKIKFAEVKNSIFEDVHYVTIFLYYDSYRPREFRGLKKDLEPENFKKWDWFNVNKIPKNTFEDSKKVIENLFE